MNHTEYFIMSLKTLFKPTGIKAYITIFTNHNVLAN